MNLLSVSDSCKRFVLGWSRFKSCCKIWFDSCCCFNQRRSGGGMKGLKPPP